MLFLSHIAPYADSIGIQAHSRTILQQIEAYLVAYEDGLIEEIRKMSDEEHQNGLAFLDFVAELRETMGQAEAAKVLRRRGRVAAQSN
jgi:hypothetical protein